MQVLRTRLNNRDVKDLKFSKTQDQDRLRPKQRLDPRSKTSVL